ncbi:MAG: TolC family protein, partial [Thermodesulfobacteriota bacterium]|nr:TolC family protein [Thermodesulfobacteriota bacterium]
MKIIKLIVIISLLLLFIPVLVCAASMSLEQCLVRGLDANPQIKAYTLAIEAAQEGVHEAFGAFLPTLSLNYGKSWLDNNGSPGTDSDYLSQQSDTFSIRLSQPLYTGYAGVAGLEKARQLRTYRESELRYMEQQLAREIKTYFYNVLRSQQLVIKWGESVERLKNQQKIARAWVEQDLAPRLRLLEIGVELAHVQQQLVDAETSLAIAAARLKEWLVFSAVEPLQVQGNLQQDLPSVCTDVEICLDLAFDQRPELFLSQLNISMAREDLKTIRARNLPQVSLDASRVDYSRNYDFHALDDEERDYYTLSLNLSMNLFQGGKTIHAHRRQKKEIQRLKQVSIQQKNAIETEVRTRFQQLIAGSSRLASAVSGVDAAREAYNFADQAARLGVSSLNDLLVAEVRLTQAEISKINADHDLQQAQ